MDRAVFLDRDGVLNEDNGYTYKLSDLRMLDGVVEGLRKISSLGYKLIIVSNQSGIARGFFTLDQMHNFMQGLINLLYKQDIEILDYYYCPHHIDGEIDEFTKSCSYRKPEPGMIFQAQKEHKLDLSQSILIGDKESDILAGQKAGLLINILIGNRYLKTDTSISYYANNLVDAANQIEKLTLQI
tara:strand:+ start:100 stop:654 length:555 start_codon:yes stop_codon:yes gene_type:complete